MKGLTTKKVELLCRLSNRSKRGVVTTHKDWFEHQCKLLNLDFESTMSWLLQNKVVLRQSRNNRYPVTINIYKEK